VSSPRRLVITHTRSGGLGTEPTLNQERKAVLKSPHSKRWCVQRHLTPALAKRLDCARLQRRFSEGIAHLTTEMLARAAGARHPRRVNARPAHHHSRLLSRWGASLAFTLIELLVVIAIIAVLAAVLFPVFARAQKTAWTRVCMSNLRQVFTAMKMYENDCGFAPPVRNYWWGWEHPELNQWNLNVILKPYAKDTTIFACEPWRRRYGKDDPYYEYRKELGYSVTINWHNGGYRNGMCPDPWFIDYCWGKGGGASPPRSFAELVAPSSYTAVVCLTVWDHIAYVDTTAGKSVIIGTVALKGDGHVEFVKFADDVSGDDQWQEYRIQYWFGGVPNGKAFVEDYYQ
jgi:prepilin-type N-terminal cleavage/methylation domain-containing protein